MIQTIQNYDEIIINQPTLVVLDIDDTILKFDTLHKNWWKNTLDNYKTIYDEFESNKRTFDDWVKIISNENAKLLDEEKLFEFMQRIKDTNSEVFFITARDKSLTDITLKNLKECKLDITPEQVYHYWSKGKKVLEVFQEKYSHLKNIIFVDDHMDNIEDVMSKFNDYVYNVDCYYIQHVNL
jgi:predicted secreted acid phosphatase